MNNNLNIGKYYTLNIEIVGKILIYWMLKLSL